MAAAVSRWWRCEGAGPLIRDVFTGTSLYRVRRLLLSPIFVRNRYPKAGRHGYGAWYRWWRGRDGADTPPIPSRSRGAALPPSHRPKHPDVDRPRGKPREPARLAACHKPIVRPCGTSFYPRRQGRRQLLKVSRGRVPMPDSARRANSYEGRRPPLPRDRVGMQRSLITSGQATMVPGSGGGLDESRNAPTRA